MESSENIGEQGLNDENELDPGETVEKFLRENPLPDESKPLSEAEKEPHTESEENASPQPAEQINDEPDLEGESSLQPSAETDMSTSISDDELPQPAEVVSYEPNLEEEIPFQSFEESGYDANADADDFPQPAEVISYEPDSTLENSPQSIERQDTLQNLSGYESLQLPTEVKDEATTPVETAPQLEEESSLTNTPLEDDYLQSIQAVTPIAASGDDAVLSVDADQITGIQEFEPEPKAKKIALILSGGGARGAFQVGAEKYARDVKNYHWDIIAGVSVGALNGAMLAMHRYTRLMQIWDDITGSQVYTGGFNLVSLVKLAFGAKSFYGNGPLQKLMQHELEAGRIIDDLHVGAVSLIDGEYVQFTKESLELAKAILASASIPVVWPPVDISPDRIAMVDGGVRNINPVGDVLDLEPDEIVIINCSAEQPPLAPQASANVLSIGLRALDIMQNEIFINDMKEFLRINALVQEAEKQGYLLHNPKTGKLLKYYPCQVIEPDTELGEVLDFSQSSVQAALRAGVRRAREVLGRP
jgi:NTE family protein